MSQSTESTETSMNGTPLHVDTNDSTGQSYDLLGPLARYTMQLRNENAVLKYRNKELEDKDDKLHSENAVLKYKNKELEDENDRLKKEIKELLYQKQDLKEELKEAIKELKKQKEKFPGIQGREKSLENVTDESKTNIKEPHSVEKTSNEADSLDECLGAALHIFSKGAGGSAHNIEQIIAYAKPANTRAESSEKPKTESKTENIK